MSADGVTAAQIVNKHGGCVHDGSGQVRVLQLDKIIPMERDFLNCWRKYGAGVLMRLDLYVAQQGIVVSNNPDFTSILVREDKIFSITHYESPRPGVAYLSELEQHKDGRLAVRKHNRLCVDGSAMHPHVLSELFVCEAPDHRKDMRASWRGLRLTIDSGARCR